MKKEFNLENIKHFVNEKLHAEREMGSKKKEDL